MSSFNRIDPTRPRPATTSPENAIENDLPAQPVISATDGGPAIESARGISPHTRDGGSFGVGSALSSPGQLGVSGPLLARGSRQVSKVKSTSTAVPELEQKVLERLQAQHGAGVVRELVKELTEAELAELSNATRTEMLARLGRANWWPGNWSPARSLYHAAPIFDAAGFESEQTMRKAVAISIRGQEEIWSAAENWGELAVPERIATLQRIADAAAKAYGVKAFKVVGFEKEPKNGLITCGWVSSFGNKIHINTNPLSLEYFFGVLDTVLHEQCHLYQHGLVKRVDDLAPNDPRAGEARAFWANERWFMYAKSSSFETYENQPLEVHARATAAAAISDLWGSEGFLRGGVLCRPGWFGRRVHVRQI